MPPARSGRPEFLPTVHGVCRTRVQLANWGYVTPDQSANGERLLGWALLRALRSHYGGGSALSQQPVSESVLTIHYRCATLAQAVQESLQLPRSTAGRWIAAAREAGYLGPSEGMGKAGG